jgi:predicted transcriptional regulator of viral defense system
MAIDDVVLRELHRAAITAGRRGIAVPSHDLDVVAAKVGGRGEAQEALQRLAMSGRVLRVRRDLAVLPDATGLHGLDIADLIDVVAPAPYLITGGAALERARLTDQHFFGMSVLVPNRVSKLRFQGQMATFFATDPSSIWGADGDTRPWYALPERAIVDVLNHPRYGVTLTQVLDALLLAASRDSGFLDRLLATVQRYGAGRKGHNSRSASRRVGLIVDRLFGADAATPYRELIGANEAPVLLRPGGRDNGPVDRTWRVVVNALIEPETVS